MRLFRAMDTANPAAGAANTLHQFRDRPVDMIFSRLWLFGGDSPANPLVAC